MKQYTRTKLGLTGWLLVMAVTLCALLMSGCGRRYEPVDVPTLEEASGGILPEGEVETSPVMILGEETGDTVSTPSDGGTAGAFTSAEAQTSARETVLTTETAPDFAAVEETVYVTGNQVILRRAAGPSGEEAAKLDKGVALKRTGYSDNWSRVLYEGQEYYISSKYVSTTSPETESAADPVRSGGSGKMIAIDPGHQAKGNSEKEPDGPGSKTMKAKVASGTQGNSTGIPEYKLTLAVSLKLKEELISRGYQVYMIRETNDVNISNAERAKMANNSGADLFIRVHANSLSDTSVHGTLTMCQTAKNPYNGSLHGKSSALSKLVAAGISERTGFKNRGVQETDTMSGINWCNIPVTIVEMGFMSNADEDQKMATDEYRDKIAKGIADGIDAYYEAGY